MILLNTIAEGSRANNTYLANVSRDPNLNTCQKFSIRLPAAMEKESSPDGTVHVM